MLKYLVMASMFLGGTPFAKDLEPVEPAKAQKAEFPVKRKTVKLEAGSLTAGQTGALVDTHDEIARFKVKSIEDDSNLIVEYDHHCWSPFDGTTTHRYHTFWLKGFSTNRPRP